MKLSIVMPVYNEEKTVTEILKRVKNIELPGIQKQIIIVNDGSTDKTHQLIKKEIGNSKNVIYLDQKENKGKGSAVKKGLEYANGDYVIIQDADLEYDPENYENLIKPVLQKKTKIVYGTRLNRLPNLKRDENNINFLLHYMGNRMLSLLVSILYGQWITDMETCYKLFPKYALDNIHINAKGFEFEPEITTKFLRQGFHILEIPITTNPRGYHEGKKLQTIPDGIKALKTIIYYRFFK